MIIFKQGNIVNDDAKVLVNTVNCVGVMGAGVAKDMKEKFPEIFVPYQRACKFNAVKPRPGNIMVTKTNDGRIVLNAFTKDHWRNKSEYSWIDECIISIADYMISTIILQNSIAIPALGCGNGGLHWEIVRDKLFMEMVAADEMTKRNHGIELDVRIYGK